MNNFESERGCAIMNKYLKEAFSRKIIITTNRTLLRDTFQILFSHFLLKFYLILWILTKAGIGLFTFYFHHELSSV